MGVGVGLERVLFRLTQPAVATGSYSYPSGSCRTIWSMRSAWKRKRGAGPI